MKYDGPQRAEGLIGEFRHAARACLPNSPPAAFPATARVPAADCLPAVSLDVGVDCGIRSWMSGVSHGNAAGRDENISLALGPHAKAVK